MPKNILRCPSCGSDILRDYFKPKAHPGPFNMLRGFSIGTSAGLYWSKEKFSFKKAEIKKHLSV